MAYKSKSKDHMVWDGTWEAANFIGDGTGITNLPAGTESDPIWVASSSAFLKVADEGKVKIDAGATAGYIGAAKTDGVLRVASPLTYSDGGNWIGLGINEEDPVWVASSSAFLKTADLAANETDPIWQANSAAIQSSLALVDPHIADGTLHFTSGAIHASLALVDPHIADSSDPHGSILTQTNLISSGVASLAEVIISGTASAATTEASYASAYSMAIIGDHEASTAAFAVGIITDVADTPPAASGFPVGTLYIQYTA